MKLINRMIILAAVLAVAACSARGELLTLNKRQAVGSPFTRYMAQEYRDMANTMHSYIFGNADMKHFARKGLAAADGVMVMPEVPNDWNLSDRDTVEMTLARVNLLQALDGGGRDMAPAEAAIAQSRFDCWAAEQGKNWNADVVCKRQFRNALRLLRAAMSDTPGAPAPTNSPAPIVSSDDASAVGGKASANGASASAAGTASDAGLPPPIGMTASGAAGGAATDGNGMGLTVSKGPLAPAQQAMFLVFFDWNKADLSADANGVLDAIAIELKSRTDLKKITVAGHADTSGSEKYNQSLSLSRANHVRDALIQRGVAADKIVAEGHGESELLVKTADNVREPGNRRAQITIE